MSLEFFKLPFSKDSLEPLISRETIDYHYNKHHRAYYTKLCDAIKNTELEHLSIEEIIKSSTGSIYNNAGQVFNHNFYWNCISPESQEPSDKLVELICSEFDSFENFKTNFLNTSNTFFGSGWSWLVYDAHKKIKITTSTNGDTPLSLGHKPLLAFDLWEHAYYIDYRNSRQTYLEKLFKIINWSFVETQI